MSLRHNRAISRSRGSWLPAYLPLSSDEAQQYLTNDMLTQLSPEVLVNLWLRPASRHLQMVFGIDPKNYPSVPGSADEGADQVGPEFATREQLDRDFAMAVVIYVEKIADNPEDVKGVDSAGGSSRTFDHAIPDRATSLLEPYRIANRKNIRRG